MPPANPTMADRARGAIVLLLSSLVALAGCVAAAGPIETAGSTPGDAPGDSPGTPPAEAAVTITVAAAADLRFAMDEIVAAYARIVPATHVEVTYGSSGSFYAQISNGAPFDLFFSADIDYPRRLEAAGLGAGPTRPYAVGRIVLWVPTASSLDVEGRGLSVLLDPAVRRIAIANPEHAPYGRAAVAALRSAGLDAGVADRLVLGENVSQTAQFVESGAAEVGIIALSLALAPTLRDQGRWWAIPPESYPPIEQGALVLRGPGDPETASHFLDFVLGPQGRAILDRYGFRLPGS